MGGKPSNVRGVGRAEMCFCENDEVRRVRADHGEGEGPFAFGETIDVEEEDVKPGGDVECLGRWWWEVLGGWCRRLGFDVSMRAGEVSKVWCVLKE